MKTQINRKQPLPSDKYIPEPGDFFFWSKEPNKVCLATKEGLPYFSEIPHLDLNENCMAHFGHFNDSEFVKLVPTGNSDGGGLTFELASEYRG